MKKYNLPAGQKPVLVTLIPLFLVLLQLILTGAAAYAQSKGNITGKAIDQVGVPLEYISIALLHEDGKVLKGALSDSSGRFSLVAVPYGRYTVKISGVGYQAFVTSVFALTPEQQRLDLGLVKLTEDSKMLSAVVISAQKKLIEQGIDRTTINVENSILAEGNTALELLERAPGVKVDEEGQISLKGRPGVTVLINGKQTYLSPKELAVLLKGTNSTSISKIEIMSNPSAKYDAAGNGGIINIQMKKNTATGLNGTVSVNGGAGRNARYGSGLNLNYRGNKINTYGSYDYGYRGETEYLDFVRRFYDGAADKAIPDRTSYQHTSTNEPLHTHNFRAGLDYEINASNTIGMLINGNVGKYTHDSKTGNRLLDPAGGLLSNMRTSNFDKQNWENLTYNLNYQHQFEKEGRELTADADFAKNAFTSRLNLSTVTDQAAAGQLVTNLVRRGYVPAVTDVYVAKIDYTDPLNKTTKLEGGLKSSFIQSDNNLRYDLLESGNWVYDTNGSNHFKYQEQIHAAYLNVNKDFGFFSIQAGLRAERTATEGHQVNSDSLIKRNYTQLFPSVFLSKPLGKDQQIQLAYSRRIERPDYGDLNPFRVFRDPLLFYQGNPFLQPELVHTFQLSHSFKNKYTTSISYNRTRNVMTWVNGQIDALNTTFESPQNLSSLTNYGITFTAATSCFGWWSGSHFANLFRNEYHGGAGAAGFNTRATSFSFNTQNSFKAGKGYSMELNALYNGGSVYGISRYKGNFMISGGVQKQLFDGKGNIKLQVNDVFQSKQFREYTKYQNIDMNSHIMLDSRRAILSFTYRFGNQNLSSKVRSTGSEDIQNRVKGGG